MDTSYLYSYNAERYQKLAERKLPCREKLNTTEVEQGVSFCQIDLQKTSVWLWRSA